MNTGERGTSGGRESSTLQGSRQGRWRRWALLASLIALTIVVAVIVVDLRGGDPGDGSRTSAADVDRDGIPDAVETIGWSTIGGRNYRTNPSLADTDGDGLTDADEAGLLTARDPSSEGAVYAGLTNPLAPDPDLDDLSDAEELDLGLDPFRADTDRDGLLDGYEVSVIGTAPDIGDSDGDGYGDAFEDSNRDTQGLDPLAFDVRVTKADYVADFAKGALAGDFWREDSVAWLLGNLASGATSSVPVVGTVVGVATDIRDAVGSAIHADWVGTGFSAVGTVPFGDAVAIPGKAAEFVARNPELAVAVAAGISLLPKVSDDIKFKSVAAVIPGADDLAAAGASKASVLRLAAGRSDLTKMSEATLRPNYQPGTPSVFLPLRWSSLKAGPAGEIALERELRASSGVVSTQVVARTGRCVDVCNTTFRRFDVVADGVAHESKVGFVVFSPAVERQIRSDAYLVETGVIDKAHWHFYPSAVSNSLGADPRILDALQENGIPFTFHLPS